MRLGDASDISWDSDVLLWSAGLLEGEGSFISARGKPVVQASMTDEDVIRKLHTGLAVGFVSGPFKKFNKDKTRRFKDTWTFMVSKQGDAAALMIALRPFLGVRRQEQVDGSLAAWVVWKEHVNNRWLSGCEHPNSVRTSEMVAAVLQEHAGLSRFAWGQSQELASRFGVSRNTIYRIVKERKRHEYK